jgi:hypothetical protein
MNTELDRLIGLLEKARAKECPSCKQRLQAQAAGTLAVPLAEILGLGALLEKLVAALSPAASAAIQAKATFVPMTPADLQEYHIARILAANASLATFDAPQGFSFAADADFTALSPEMQAQYMAKMADDGWAMALEQTRSGQNGDPCRWLRDTVAANEKNRQWGTNPKNAVRAAKNDPGIEVDYGIFEQVLGPEDYMWDGGMDRWLSSMRQAILKYCGGDARSGNAMTDYYIRTTGHEPIP